MWKIKLWKDNHRCGQPSCGRTTTKIHNHSNVTHRSGGFQLHRICHLRQIFKFHSISARVGGVKLRRPYVQRLAGPCPAILNLSYVDSAASWSSGPASVRGPADLHQCVVQQRTSISAWSSGPASVRGPAADRHQRAVQLRSGINETPVHRVPQKIARMTLFFLLFISYCTTSFIEVKHVY